MGQQGKDQRVHRARAKPVERQGMVAILALQEELDNLPQILAGEVRGIKTRRIVIRRQAV